MSSQQGPQNGKPTRIVAGVDGSRDGLRAVEYATRAAMRVDGELHLVHAVDDAVLAGAWGVVQDAAAMERVGADVLKEATEKALELGLPADRIRSEMELGNPAALLARASESAGRLIVGRRRLSGLERMFVGSTSASLASVAHCPVIVVSAAVNPDATGAHGIVAAGVDSDGHSDHTLVAAHEEAVARGARLMITHVQPPVPVGMFGGYQLTDEAEKELLAAAREAIDEMIERALGAPRVPYEIVVAAGDPVDRLIDLSNEVDLLVLGQRAPARLGFAIGGMSRAVMAHAQCPLMVVAGK